MYSRGYIFNIMYSDSDTEIKFKNLFFNVKAGKRGNSSVAKCTIDICFYILGEN